MAGCGRHRQAISTPAFCSSAPARPAISPQIGFVAGVALQRAVAMVTGLAVPRLALKWPNDLLLDGAKIAGILVEGTMLPGGGPLAVVIGIGDQCRPSPRWTRHIAPPTCARLRLRSAA